MAIGFDPVLKKMKNRVLDAVFPRFCVACEREGSLLCDTCFVIWEPKEPEEAVNVFSVFPYGDPVTRDLIRSWKYHFDDSAWRVLQQKIRPRLHALMQVVRSRQVEAVVPVPLHETRLCERGFDQAKQVAQFVSTELGIPVHDGLVRVRATGKQSERAEAERVAEMQQSPFVATDRCPSSVLLVDDVWTTGATSQAAAETLQRAGAKNISIFTIAKG